MSATVVNAEEPRISESRVLAVLRENNRELAPSELVAIVLELSPELSDVDVKRAVWSLIAKGQIRFSSEQLLSPAQEIGQKAA